MTDKSKLRQIRENIPKVYDSGWEVGYDTGNAEGFSQGYAQGYNNGTAAATPKGEVELTENNKTYDVTKYASAKVNIAGLEDLSPALTEQEELVAELKSVIAQKAKLGDAKLPSLIDGTVTELTAEDLAGATKIGTYAFYGCSKLTSIEIPSTVTKFESSAFENVPNLSKVIIPSLEYWFGLSFNYNRTNPLQTQGKPMLYVDNTPITDVTVPQGTVLGDYTFYYYGGLKSLVLNAAPSAYMCEGCSNLTNVTLGENVTSTGYYAFANTAIESIVIPPSVYIFGRASFRQCTLLKSVVIQGAIEQYSSSNTFERCSALVSVDLGSPKGIPTSCFYNCTSLPSIKIPSTVEKIRSQAFYGCSALEYVDLTAYGTDGAFPSLENVNVFTNCGTSIASGTFEIRVPSGRKAELAAMTNWSTYADNIVEV